MLYVSLPPPVNPPPPWCRRAERKEAMREKTAKVRSGEVKPSF